MTEYAFTVPREPEIAEFAIADPPDAWRALGFQVNDDDNLDIGMVRIRLLGGGAGGITSWALRRVDAVGDIDGLPVHTPRFSSPPPFYTHPNGATSIDTVVIQSPDFKRTADAFARAGMPLKREALIEGRGHMGFRRLGPVILELVARPDLGGEDSRFWGLTVVVISLEDLAARLGDLLGPIRPALQPGRRIATLSADAGISVPLAFMSPEPP
ncbi:MAG TPA: hypothetical protein VME01_09650 [Solirubrobacteraceae bacterium]|nr:hypothetical protein [Solirubrobacteraceae bacterium]